MGDFRVDWPALRVVVEDADPQPARVRAELLDVGTCGRRRDHGVADAWAVCRVEQCGRVTNGAADAVLDRQSALVAESGRA